MPSPATLPGARSRVFLVVGTLDPSDGQPVLELADAKDPDNRLTLRPGLPPVQMPRHPGLATVLLTGRRDGELVWGEARGLALSLDQLGSDLPDEAICLILLDLCDVLGTLHANGVAHGDLRAPNLLVGTDGWVTVAGAGIRKGSVEEDLGALVHLRRELLCEEAPGSAEVAPFAVAAIEDALRRRLGDAEIQELRRGLSTVVRARVPILDVASLPAIRVVMEDGSSVAGAFDEVGMDLGPDVDTTSGDVWTTNPEVTREALLDDPTEEVASTRGPRSSRVQILARLLAPPACAVRPDRFAGGEGIVCEPMRQRISEERPDPLFMFDDSSVLAPSEPEGVKPAPRARPMENPTSSPSPTPALIGQALVHRRLAASLKDWPPVTMALIGANVAIHLAVGVYDLLHGRTSLFGVVFGDRSVESLDAWGARVPRLISLGEPWRLLTCTFLHAGALHLFMNMVALWGLGRLAEAVYGPVRFLWLYLLCGLCGSVLSNAAGGTSVGASGAIFGIMGACIVYGRRFSHVLPPPAQPYFGRKLLPWVGINLLIGFSIPRIDQLGHVGGLVGGLVLAALIGTRVIPGKEGSPTTARLMAFGSAVLLGWAVTGVTVSLLGL